MIVEMDAEIICRALNSEGTDASPFGLIIVDCKFLFCSFIDISFCFVRRSANKAAHALTKAAYSMSEVIYWDFCPEFLSIVIDFDLS